MVGTLVVRRLERRTGELPASSVRRTEAAWIAFWVVVALFVWIGAELT